MYVVVDGMNYTVCGIVVDMCLVFEPRHTLTALQAKRAELAVAPSPSPRVRSGQCNGDDIDDDEIYTMMVMNE